MMDDEVEISVNEPQQRSEIGGVNKFFVYTLKGKDEKGQIEIFRRYSDFNVLREVLVKRWPGCYIPSLPEKKTIGSGEHLFIESRRRGLQIFLQTLSLNGAIWSSEQMQIFLRNNSGDVQKHLSSFLKQSPEKLLSRLKSVFVEYDRGEIVAAVVAKAAEFASYIKDSRVFLQKLIESTEKMHEVYRSSMEKKLALLEFALPDYEKYCLLENDEKKKVEGLLFANGELEMKKVVDKYRVSSDYPSVMLVSEEIKREKKELEAFQEVIRVKNQYEAHRLKISNKVKDFELKESKINAGKESFFSKIKKQSKEDQLAQNKVELDQAKEQEAMYASLTQIIFNLIGLREIERFKQLRQKAYYKMLKTFATCQKEMASAESDIWAKVCEHERIGQEGQSLGFKAEKVEQMLSRVQASPQVHQVKPQ